MPYFIKDMMRECAQRINELSPIQVAYLSKGLIGLRKLIDDKNTLYE